MKHLFATSVLVVAFQAWVAQAANYVMSGSDAINTTSFNTGLNWTGGAAPTGGNTYQTGPFRLRSPANAADITFAGDSLTIQGGGGELRMKTGATVTIANFLLADTAIVDLTQPSGGNAGTLAGNITLNGTVTLQSGIQASENVDQLTISAPMNGVGGFTTTGTFGTIILTATNNYSGGTTVNGGSLLINGVLTSSAVTVTSGTLGGTGIIKGAVTNQASGTLQPGLGGTDTSTLTISNNLVLAGNTLFTLNRSSTPNASKISGVSTLTLGGTLTVSNAGGPLQLGDSFQLLNAANYAGSLTAFSLPVLTSGLAWSNRLAVNGSIVVVTAPPTGAGVWTNDASGNWSAAGNWLGGIVASGTDSNANFSTINITADRRVTLDSSRTIGNLLFGDISGLQNWFLNASGGSALTLAVSSGSPTISVNNNTATVNAPLAGTVGLTTTGAGTLVLGGNNTYTGVTTVNAGTLNVSGTVASTGNTIVGNAAGNAVLGVSGTISPYFTIVGTVNNSVGAIYQTGGTINSAVNSGYENLSLGNIAGSFGYFDAAGGTYSTYGIAVGGEDNNGTTANFGVATGNGIFEVSGGTVNNTGWIVGSRSPAAQISEVNMFSGSLTFAAGGFVNNWGAGQTTMVNILGGTLSTIANNGIGFNDGIGVVNLLGGVTTVSAITGAGAPLNGQVSFNGGTLQASGATTALLSVGSAYVYPGGGTLDNNGNAVTVAQPLLAPTGNGIYSIASFTGGAGYIAPPIITINNTGGDSIGSGATAIAQINPLTGVLTNVIITCPGVNYTVTPIFVASGGGATTQATITGGPLSPNSSGGLTVAGGGTLTLAGANTYTGNTVVNNGTLLVTGSLAGTAAVAGGATLGGNGIIRGAVTNSAAGFLQPGLGGADTSTLAISNRLILAGTTVMTLNRNNAQNASAIIGITTLTQGGTLIVTNVGPPLQADDSFTLFQASTYTGTFSVTNLPALATGLAWTNLISRNGTIAVVSTLPPGSPVVANLPASQVLATSANLNGQVLSTGGQIPSVTIYYGINDGGTNPSAWGHNLFLGANNSTFTALASGLATNTIYYFTAFAANAAGGTWAAPSQSFTTLAVNPSATRIPVTTYHYDNTRQGQNTNETLLTLANVNTNTFGKLFSYSVDAYVYSEPLIMTNLAIPAQGVHDVVFIATEHDTVYAFDADSNAGTNGGLLWKNNLGISALSSSGAFGFRYTGAGYPDIVPEVGATGTPVIDPATGTLYVDAFTHEGASYIHRIHALDITTGNERPYSPVVVAGSVPGHGVDSVGGVMTFSAIQHNQRPALTLAGGRLYVGYAGYADTDPYHGWLFGYNATNLVLETNYIFNSTPNASASAFGSHAAEGGIWQGGGGLVVDANTNLYFETGNGSFSQNTNGGDYADSFLKLSTTNGLAIADYFTPYNQAALQSADLDLGACGPVLLPDSAGSVAHPHLLVGSGKNGTIYLLDCDNLGHYNGTDGVNGNDNQIVQSVTGKISTIWSPPAYFNHLLFFQSSSSVMRSFAIASGALSASPVSSGGLSVGAYNGGPVVSANGTNNAIVWGLNSAAFASSGPGVLYAFNATNLAQTLYTSSQLAARDNPGGAVKLTTPTVAGGKVYVPAQYTLSVYGVQVFLDAPIISPNGGAFTNQVTITLADASPGAAIYYTLDGTTPTAGSTLYSGPFILTTNALLQAIALQAGAVNSAVTSAMFDNTAALGGGTGLTGEYFTNHTSVSPFSGSPVLVQTNATIHFNWGTSGPAPQVGGTSFTVRWTGCVQPQFSETYTFSTTADDGVRLFVNGQLLIDDWVDKTNATTRSNSVTLAAQQLYNVELDYYQKAGNASVALDWSSPSTPSGSVPQTQLYSYTNPPPTVLFTSPANNSSYTAAASVTVSAEADAPYNPVAAVSFYANGALLGSVSDAPYTFTTTGLGAGSYALTVVATDGSGLSSTSAPVNITVAPGNGQPYGLISNAPVTAYLNMPTTFTGALPTLLSGTGAFSDTPDRVPSGGLIPYIPNTPLWSDNAVKSRYLAVPNTGGVLTPDQQINFLPTNSWAFPAGTVFVKNFDLVVNETNPAVPLRRLETRLLVRNLNGTVYGVTYKWRPDNSDADLLTSSLNEDILITNATGVSTQTWYYPSPSDCLTCHTPAANYVLGLSTRQLNGSQTYPATGVTDNQLRTFNRLGLFNPAFDESAITNFEKLSALTNLTASLEDRARSYLDANCAMCHQPGGTGITFDGRYDTLLTSQKITNYPASFNLGYDNADIIKARDVWRSMVWQRMNTTNNAYKMPPLARNLIDTNAVQVFTYWINSLPGTPALPPPTLSPDGGSYVASVSVAVQPPTNNMLVYYTLDGSLPTTNSLLYAGPFNLLNSTTVSASTFAAGYANSVATSALFLVEPLHFTSQGFTNNVFRLGFAGTTGSNYVLQASTNLSNWTPISTNLAATNLFNLFDVKATNYPYRFYRVLRQ